jgi:hypothetical protein
VNGTVGKIVDIEVTADQATKQHLTPPTVGLTFSTAGSGADALVFAIVPAQTTCGQNGTLDAGQCCIIALQADTTQISLSLPENKKGQPRSLIIHGKLLVHADNITPAKKSSVTKPMQVKVVPSTLTPSL